MRAVEFQGKLKDRDEWISGSLVLHGEDAMIFTVRGFPEGTGMFHVDPVTVGQYTGRTDEKKMKIFENHIVSFEQFKSTHIGKVVFNERTCGFEIWFSTVVGAYGEKATHKVNFSNINNIEVIGNIYDNPELLHK